MLCYGDGTGVGSQSLASMLWATSAGWDARRAVQKNLKSQGPCWDNEVEFQGNAEFKAGQ